MWNVDEKVKELIQHFGGLAPKVANHTLETLNEHMESFSQAVIFWKKVKNQLDQL